MSSRDDSTVDRAQTELEYAEYGTLLIPACSDILVLLDDDRAVRYVSPSAWRLLGRESEEIKDGDLTGLFHDEDRERATHLLDQASSELNWGDAVECRMRHADGSWRTMEMYSRSLEEAQDAVSGSVVTFRDVTDRKEFEVALALSTRHQRLLSLVPSPVLVLDTDHQVIYVNSASVKLFEAPGTELLGRSFVDLVRPEGRPRLEDVLRRTSQHDRGADVQVRLSGPDGDDVVLEIRFLALSWDGEPALAGFAQDVTRWTNDQEDLRRRVLFDELTGLPNRSLLRDRLDHALVSRTRTGARPMVMFLDIDRFKAVNDSFGHHAGDELLVEIAARLRAAVRPQDTVARFGGDEFVVLVDDVEDVEEALAVARRVSEPFSIPVEVGGTTITVAASVGLAGGPDLELVGGSTSDLLQAADTAMHEAKLRGDGIEFYTPELQEAALDHLRLESDLRQALGDGHIDVAFQPIVFLDDHSIVGAEALARWSHPERGSIGPATFVPIAENAGLIDDLGTQVLHDAVNQVREWAGDGLVRGNFAIHVNVSAVQLQGRAIVADVTEVLDGLPGGVSVLLELTESVIMSEDDGSRAVLRELREAGARIGIDDFGTGYSSLAYLAQLPADTVKLDRQFVSRLDDGRSARVAGVVVALGETLGMDVVAEGVEAPSEETALRELGVQLAQGYLFGRPMPGTEFRELLAT
ncbi:putative bifunctional diguanylate cyclase/phosphodiesterase [Rhabdothermincola salaria]|uniref:putative bifunctional diguanylate cyclase/phosphodiesterase n=1 Tax=Rhabdothermincola salaria TaxID=2903142 RepID=UPI001E2D50F1|nr:EAL domain-containing protein [Rhabdothermincola salaria]MCD9623270.1 EAL domain-containing protein [Rhabdothermincola salaria]